MTFREYEVIEPANEEELGERLRSEALATGVLNLIVLELLNELDKQRYKGEVSQEDITMKIDALHLGDSSDRLPFINGYIEGLSSGAAATGRLQVNANKNTPQGKRSLTLHIHQDE